MSLVSRAVPAIEELINGTRGQSELSNKLNSIKPTDTTDNETSIETNMESIKLGKNDLLALCPILLYQTVTRSGCITTPLLPSEQQHDHDHDYIHEDDRKMGKQQTFLSYIGSSQ